MKLKTTTGIVLDDDYGMAKSITAWVVKAGLKGITCYYVENFRTYALFQNGIPIFESRKAEDILVHIDILAMVERGI